MFRPDAGLGMRIARTVLVPYGPLLVTIVLAGLGSGMLSESGFGLLVALSIAWFLCSLILVPALTFRSRGSSDGGGSSDGPPEPSSPSGGPGSGPGEIPLPDAEQSRDRIRDHVRRKRRWPRRRPAREPEQTPVRPR